MRETLMTRYDDNVGVGLYDSIKWLHETVLSEPDNLVVNSAVVHGHHEDLPYRIEFFSESTPLVTSVPVRVWWDDENLENASK